MLSQVEGHAVFTSEPLLELLRGLVQKALKFMHCVRGFGDTSEFRVRCELFVAGFGEESVINCLLYQVEPVLVLVGIGPGHPSMIEVVPDCLLHGLWQP